MPKKVYLSGPTSSDWREAATRRLEEQGVGVMNPAMRVCGVKEEAAREIVETDKRDIDSCDWVLVNFQKPSARVAMEILYAWERGKTVIVATGGSHRFPWLEYHSHILVEHLDEALSEITRPIGA